MREIRRNKIHAIRYIGRQPVNSPIDRYQTDLEEIPSHQSVARSFSIVFSLSVSLRCHQRNAIVKTAVLPSTERRGRLPPGLCIGYH